MKLYGITTSDKVTKGVGGDEYIEIELKVKNKRIGFIYLDYKNDKQDHDCEQDEWILQWKDCRRGFDNKTDPTIIAQDNI